MASTKMTLHVTVEIKPKITFANALKLRLAGKKYKLASDELLKTIKEGKKK